MMAKLMLRKGVKNMKRVLKTILAVLMVMVITVVPVMAAGSNSDYAKFPATGSQYANTYKAQTVAVQRFLMVHKRSYATRLAAKGGTDGYFGEETTNVTREYQEERNLVIDGKVGPATWTMIGSELVEVGVDSVGPVQRHNGYNVLIIISDGVGVGYIACTDKNTSTSIFYYISKY